ncbi:MAG TPA: CapA family protein [Bacteroidales bacterium]|nr:CapA family protein [Bacteroidales bacterium]HRW94714.1 CapA family protein [Bacteroidales bacterium]
MKNYSFLLFFAGIMFILPGWLLAQDPEAIRFCFAGDLMQHGSQIRSALQDDGSYNYDTCFIYVKDRFNKAHFAGLNMETTFNGPPYSGYPSFSSPGQLAQAIQRAGVNVFLTANNHTYDKGTEGARKTIALYDSLGVKHCGIDPPWIILEEDGTKIAVLNYTYNSNKSLHGTNPGLNRIDTNLIKKHISEVRDNGAQSIICCMHWGHEYRIHPSGHQKSLSEWLYKEGVSVVVGSHPHVPQSIDIKRDSCGRIVFLSAYSLGNFISNQPDPLTRMGMILSFGISLTQEGPRVDFPWYEWIWCWRPVTDGEKTYMVLPVSDPRIYADMEEISPDLPVIDKTIKTLRNFMRETSPGIYERRRNPQYERKNLYFGDHPPFSSVWTGQFPVTSSERSIPPIEDLRTRRANKSTGLAGNY